MFELQTPNIGFKHFGTCSKGIWGQSSHEVIQGHRGSLSVKNKIIAIPHAFLTYSKT